MSASTQVEIGKKTRARVSEVLSPRDGRTADDVAAILARAGAAAHRNTVRNHLLALVRSRKAKKKVEGRKTLFFARVK